MNNSLVSKILPHVIAYAVFVAVAFIFFYPYVFQHKTLQMSDNIQAAGMQAEMRKVQAETGDLPLWTNSMFGGMPTYQIMYDSKNLLEKPFKMFLWGNSMASPHTAMILVMLGLYILLLTMKVDWRLSMAGAICFVLGTNFLDLIITGHSTKVIALGYLPPILAGILLAFRGKYLLGGAVAAFFMGLELWANHVQVTYYFLLTLLCFGVAAFYKAIKNNTLPNFGKASATIVVAFILAFATNTGRLWATYEFSAETIRGKSELSKGIISEDSNISTDGMSKKYAFSWSSGKLESFTLLVPKFMGESSGRNFLNERNSEVLKELQKNPTMRQVPQAQQQQFLQQISQFTSYYWGNQPFVGGPYYFGAVVLLFFFLGIFLVHSPHKWWLVAGAALMVMISWGRHFPALNYTLYDYLPMFDKFRAVTTSLSVGWLLVVTLAFWGVKEFLEKNHTDEEKRKALFKATSVIGGLLLITLFMSFGMIDLMPSEKIADLQASAADNQGAKLMLDIIEDIQPALEAERGSFMREDILRSFIYVALAFGGLFFFLKQKSRPKYLVFAVAALAVFDLFGVSKRYFSENTFINPQQKENISAPTPADQQILKDTDPHYRVFDSQRGGFSSAIASFHHESLGGYNAAKLMRYQELIEKYLSSPGQYPQIFDMLNTKYFINGGKATRNPNALGNAWFVDSYEIVENGDAEFLGLADLKPGEKALVQKKYAASLDGLNIKKDSTASIRLTKYSPDHMEYEYSANSEQLAVFSEIYYPPEKGWKLYLNGKEIELIKADYILRAARLPAGKNMKLEMSFHPTSYYVGENISLIASLIVLLGFVGVIGWAFKNNVLDAKDSTAKMAAPISSENKKLKPTASKKEKRKKK